MTYSLESSIIKSDEDNAFYGLISKYSEVLFCLFFASVIYVNFYKILILIERPGIGK